MMARLLDGVPRRGLAWLAALLAVLLRGAAGSPTTICSPS